MRIADFRSDTLTHPTEAMRDAMARAEVGDDVFGEDPTVNALEALAAARLKKEASIFLPSGTMANLVAQLVHCARGDEVIVGARSHTFTYERGGCAVLGGIHPYPIPNEDDGTLSLEALEAAIRPEDIHCPPTRLIILENTQNICSGTPLGAEYTSAVARLAHSRGVKLHVDGARLFNAAVALKVKASTLVAEADSVCFCLSKGLACPVGSLLCGDRAFVSEARAMRKLLGGGMRQAGVLAAAGIVALESMIDRLADDHALARRLAEGIARIPGLSAHPDRVHTNILFFNVTHPLLDGDDVVERLEREGIRMLSLAPRQVRALTHYEITPADVERTLEVLEDLMRAAP